MQSYYEKLVSEQGAEAAKEYMRQLRGKRRTYKTGLNFKSAAVRKKALETRQQNDTTDHTR